MSRISLLSYSFDFKILFHIISTFKFQNTMAEFSNSLHCGGWVHSVSFSGDGNRLASVGHDSSVSIADTTRGMAIYKVSNLRLNYMGEGRDNF